MRGYWKYMCMNEVHLLTKTLNNFVDNQCNETSGLKYYCKSLCNSKCEHIRNPGSCNTTETCWYGCHCEEVSCMLYTIFCDMCMYDTLWSMYTACQLCFTLLCALGDGGKRWRRMCETKRLRLCSGDKLSWNWWIFDFDSTWRSFWEGMLHMVCFFNDCCTFYASRYVC